MAVAVGAWIGATDGLVYWRDAGLANMGDGLNPHTRSEDALDDALLLWTARIARPAGPGAAVAGAAGLLQNGRSVLPSVVSVGLSRRVDAIICAYEWSCADALAVFYCESGGWSLDVIYGPREGAAGERGIAQLHPVHRARAARLGYTWGDMFDPAANLAVAWDIYAEQGWAPWTCWNGGYP